MDMSSIASTITALKTATDIAKAISGLKADVEIRSKVIELQSQILQAQGCALNAQSEQSQLISENESLKSWEAEKKRYALKEMFRGQFAYELKKGELQGGEPIT